MNNGRFQQLRYGGAGRHQFFRQVRRCFQVRARVLAPPNPEVDFPRGPFDERGGMERCQTSRVGCHLLLGKRSGLGKIR